MKYIIFCVLIYSVGLISGCGKDTVINEGGSGGGSDLTRSGKFISFTSNREGNYDIYLAQVNSNGVLETSNLVYPTNPFNLTLANVTDDKQSNWSPDGRVLVFSRTQGNNQEIYAFFFSENGRIDSTVSLNPAKLFSSGGNWDNNPSFSPDGVHLIWDRRQDNANPPGVDTADSRDIYMGDVRGSGDSFTVYNIRQITNTIGQDEYNPKWSPKISVGRIAYENAGSPTASDHDVYVIDPFNTSNNVNYYNPGRSGYPAWEPSCTKIIFEADQGNSGYYKIVTGGYPTSGTPVDLIQSNTQHNRYPTWLPNGGLIAYINFTSNNGAIFIVPSGGGSPFKLLPPAYDAANNLWPAW